MRIVVPGTENSDVAPGFPGLCPYVQLPAARMLAVLGLIFIVTGCGGTAQKPLPLSRWLSGHPAEQSVTLRLIAHGNGVSSGDLNGYRRGRVLVEVPRGWRVVVRCVNAATSTHHSCAIVDNSLSTRPAFPGAATPAPLVGLAPGRSATFSFLARRPGDFQIACLVDDNEIGNEMWDALQVGGTRRPSVIPLRRVRR